MGFQVGFQTALSSTVAAMGKLMDPLVAEIRSGFAHLHPTNVPRTRNSGSQPFPAGKRRRVIMEPALPDGVITVNNDGVDSSDVVKQITNDITNSSSGPAPPPLTDEITGTDTILSPLRAAVPESRTDRIWIRLSNISTAVTTDDVVASVKRRLATEDVVAFCLLKKGARVDSMSWLSFKVRVPASLRDKALTPSTWPADVGVREFIQSMRSRYRDSPRARSHDHEPHHSSSPFTTERRRSSLEPPSITNTPTHISVQFSNGTMNDTSEAPNVTLVEGPSQIRNTVMRNDAMRKLHQTSLDNFFL
ncbi:uncharacterized protein LOC131292793 [Anopheles ziemanni]|uniref:uncharacterized protein LOC131271143 n=1 Tax=Anopheles coustani TaxID=139045 RepID=UPI0026599C9D|nr:uncharacterized protein LOC131271143 [Anopheles coustani]XP_058176858.1 uncharacterized protein LOC131292793 [Anopheles ziemanni]